MIGDALIASSFIPYVGPFTKPFQSDLMDEVFYPFLIKRENKGQWRRQSHTHKKEYQSIEGTYVRS